MCFEEFIQNSDSLKSFDLIQVQKAREVLGFVYNVSPEIIYPSDKGESLALLGQLYEPYGLEVVINVAKKLTITLNESQVDRIINRIYKNAKNVETLIAILLEELREARKDINEEDN